MSLSANFPTTRPSLLLDFVNSGQMDPRITFSRASGATWFNSAGTLIGVDASSSSLTVGTGQQTLTLAATAGVDRGWIVGTSVLLSASTVTNTMTGVVVSYTASTQVLVVNVASVVGSGTYATWQVSNLMPRFDYNPSTLAAQGLLIEESRTNLLLQSADFTTTWGQTNVTITANTTASPDGGTNGDTLLINSAGAATNQTSQTFTAGSTITITVFAKKNASNFLRIEAGNLVNCWFNLDIGVTGTNSAGSGNVLFSAKSIQAISGGWYRCVLTVTTSTITTLGVLLFATNTDNNTSSINSSIFLWGAQLEAGAFPTSYIPTTTTALTRAADVASVNTLSPWFNASAGTIYAEASVTSTDAANKFAAALSDGATSNYIAVFRQSDAQPVGQVQATTPQAALGTGATWTTTTPRKLALAYATNDFAFSANGSAAVTDSSGTVPTVNQLQLGVIGSSQRLNGYLSRVTYYPTRLSNAQLQAITA
jgi:hypothetical protein